MFNEPCIGSRIIELFEKLERELQIPVGGWLGSGDDEGRGKLR